MGRQRFLAAHAGGGRWPHGRFFTHARLPVVVAASIVPTTYGTRARPPAVDLRCHCCTPTRPPPDPVRPAAVRLPETPPPFRHPCHHVTGGGHHEEQAGAGPDARRCRQPHMPGLQRGAVRHELLLPVAHRLPHRRRRHLDGPHRRCARRVARPCGAAQGRLALPLCRARRVVGRHHGRGVVAPHLPRWFPQRRHAVRVVGVCGVACGRRRVGRRGGLAVGPRRRRRGGGRRRGQGLVGPPVGRPGSPRGRAGGGCRARLRSVLGRGGGGGGGACRAGCTSDG